MGGTEPAITEVQMQCNMAQLASQYGSHAAMDSGSWYWVGFDARLWKQNEVCALCLLLMFLVLRKADDDSPQMGTARECQETQCPAPVASNASWYAGSGTISLFDNYEG